MLLRTTVPALCVLASVAGAAEVPVLRLAQVFSDHAVLQRERPLPVWGWAAPGAAVTVTLAGQSRSATAGADGAWRVAFDPLKSGGPALELVATSGELKAAAGDLLVGEVWVCSGQSNMEWGMSWGVNDGDQEIAAATFPSIRLLNVPKNAAAKPADDITATWASCTPASIAQFSSVAYFFGRELHRTLDVPVGLIESAWGGTPAQSWASREALAADPAIAGYVKQFDDVMADYPAALARYEEAQKATVAAAVKVDDAGWEDPAADVSAWKQMQLPQYWEKAGLNIDGVVWFRRSFEVPAGLAGKDLVLGLGPIDDQDTTYWDGQKVGAMTAWNSPREYTIPARLATPGKHVLAVRVVDTGGGGGFHGTPEQMALTAPGADAVPLNGAWLYRVAEEIPTKPQPPMGPGNPWLPTSLRNGMITPIVPFAIRGAIWYQGESNAGAAWQYRTLFPAMISDWRKAWGQGDLPFYFVQLANFMDPAADPGESEWAELRDAQTFTLRKLPATGMASAIDIGDAKNIHPRNKQEVGRRLALWALAQVHGRAVEPSGPLYTASQTESGRIRISFDHLGGGLVAQGGPLKRFQIAGEDKAWVWADAVIDGDTVVVSSPKVPKPVAVRYAWANNPEGCNLYNKAGLPASPFRTDAWPAVTDR